MYFAPKVSPASNTEQHGGLCRGDDVLWLSVQGPPTRMVQALASPPSAQAPAALRAQSGQARPAALPHREPLPASAHARNPSSAAAGENMLPEDIETGSAGAASLSSSAQDAPADSSLRGAPLS